MSASPINPYEPPRIIPDPPTKYFKNVVKNANCCELWRMTSPNVVAFMVGLFIKTFRINVPATIAFAGGEQLRLELDEIPISMRERFATESSELLALGYSPAFGMRIPVVGNGENYAIVYLGPGSDRLTG